MRIVDLISEYYNYHKELIKNLKKDKIFRINIDMCDIHNLCHIPKSTIFTHKGMGVVIGSGVKLGENVVIYPNVTLGSRHMYKDDFPTIEDNVIIFTGACIIGDITIGHDSIVGAHSLVLKDVPPYSIVYGIPTVIKDGFLAK